MTMEQPAVIREQFGHRESEFIGIGLPSARGIRAMQCLALAAKHAFKSGLATVAASACAIS
jgi:hypothetical protein